MIAYKSFKVSDDAQLNAFIATHPPLGNQEKGESGIVIHDGYFIVRHEDGSPINEKAAYLSNINQALNASRSNLVISTIQAQTTTSELRGMFKTMTLDEIMSKNRDWFVKYYQDKKLSYKQAGELADIVVKARQQRLMDELTAERTKDINIPILESLIESYG